ncbi:MAG: hypothetical protein ABWJ42_03440 [Sulfolobales archaeon]
METLVGVSLMIIGVLILIIGLIVYLLPEIRRAVVAIPENIRVLLYISLKIGDLEIIVSPILILILVIIYILLLYRGVV